MSGVTTLDWTAIARGFAGQAKACARDDASPTSAAILNGCAAALADDRHPLRAIVATVERQDADAAVALRVLGALHRLALDGTAKELAAIMPSAGGSVRIDRAWPVADAAIRSHGDFIRGYLANAPQTNEVGRSAMLLGGFLAVAAATKKPLRLLEIGASAGLICFGTAIALRARPSPGARPSPPSSCGRHGRAPRRNWTRRSKWSNAPAATARPSTSPLPTTSGAWSPISGPISWNV